MSPIISIGWVAIEAAVVRDDGELYCSEWLWDHCDRI